MAVGDPWFGNMEPKIILMTLLIAAIQLLAHIGGRAETGAGEPAE